MKIKIDWTREVSGVSEVEVDPQKVADWLNEPYNRAPTEPERTPESITPKDAFDWLESGDDDVWLEQVDLEKDITPFPWGDEVELERLHVD